MTLTDDAVIGDVQCKECRDGFGRSTFSEVSISDVSPNFLRYLRALEESFELLKEKRLLGRIERNEAIINKVQQAREAME